ncbi:MAG: UvrB/UvrC motif-containing protein, partial [Prevotellaceae bacterium]|nr:UvrB/UvrC motif-containing protein [Prevotellaceae bacterium]
AHGITPRQIQKSRNRNLFALAGGEEEMEVAGAYGKGSTAGKERLSFNKGKGNDRGNVVDNGGKAAPKPYMEQQGTASVVADPVLQYMSRQQLEKSIARTRKLMQEAAKKLNFIEAAQYRDEVLRLEELLQKKPA